MDSKNVLVSEQLRKNYENYYEEGDSDWRYLGAIDKANNITSLCRDLSICSVIEIGAGEGAVLKRLSELGFGNVLNALEISPSGVETIKKKNISRLKDCTLFDGYNIQYPTKQFDLAILCHVLEHVEFPRKLLYEAKRIAKYVYIEVPLEDTIRLPRDFEWEKTGHINFYSPKTIQRLVQTCNFEILRHKITNPSKATYTFQKGKKGLFPFFIKEILLKLLPGFATGVFTYHSSLICREKNYVSL